MTNKPSNAGHEIGDTEFQYIRALESVMQKHEPMTPGQFARSQGLAGTSSLKRYHTLKRILNIYGWISASERMRGTFPSLIDEFSGGALAAREELTKRLAELEEAYAAERKRLEARIELLEGENDRVKGLLSYTIAHFVGKNMERGKEIEAKIRHWARELGADPEHQQMASRAIERLFASVGLRKVLDEKDVP